MMSEPLRTLLIVDDDLLAREVLCLVAAEAGFAATPLESGEAALAYLALHRNDPPSALLVDMQMTGLCGDALGMRLRAICGETPLLLAMSGSVVELEQRMHFNGFLLKPFDFITFTQALSGAPAAAIPAATALATDVVDVLHQPTFDAFAQTMTQGQLGALYQMCLDDADKRVMLMRTAIESADTETYTRAAHAIKGSCGMVGALELAALACAMEQNGPPAESTIDHLDPFAEFIAAQARLRSMLNARA